MAATFFRRSVDSATRLSLFERSWLAERYEMVKASGPRARLEFLHANMPRISEMTHLCARLATARYRVVFEMIFRGACSWTVVIVFNLRAGRATSALSLRCGDSTMMKVEDSYIFGIRLIAMTEATVTTSAEMIITSLRRRRA